MQKIVTNRCYGGFSLSQPAMLRYAEIKGIKLYPAQQRGLVIYWLVPKDQRTQSNEAYARDTIYARYIERDDPALIQTIEELGEAANGEFTKLEITEIPDGVEWKVEEYDGQEWVAEAHRTW